MKHWWKYVVLVAFGICTFVLGGSWAQLVRGEFQIAFLDVGQGDAVLITAPNGNQLLYDAGPPSGAALRALGKQLPFWDRSINVIVLSHPDLDHTGGFPEVLRRYRVDLALEPGVFSGNGAYETIESEIKRHNVPHFDVREGMRIVLDDTTYADVLFPGAVRMSSDTNDNSIVLRVVHGNTAFLLSGDLSIKYEEYVVARYGDQLNANVLKLGHHGSRTSTSPRWLAAISPETAVISYGKENTYGHPHDEPIVALSELQIPYLETAKEGTIVFASDGETVWRK